MAFVVAMLPLLGFGAYVHEGPGFWCSVQWEEKSPAADVYIVFMFGTSFVWPLFLIVFSVTGALMQIRKVRKPRRWRWCRYSRPPADYL